MNFLKKLCCKNFSDKIRKISCIIYSFFLEKQTKKQKKSKINWTNWNFCILSAHFFGKRQKNLLGLVAQSVEQRPFKAKVPGSSPGKSTTLDTHKIFSEEKIFYFSFSSKNEKSCRTLKNFDIFWFLCDFCFMKIIKIYFGFEKILISVYF